MLNYKTIRFVLSESVYTCSIIDRSTLPDDVNALKDMVCEYASKVAALIERVEQLEERYFKLARLHFGQSSEKLSTVREENTSPSDPLSENLLDESLITTDPAIDTITDIVVDTATDMRQDPANENDTDLTKEEPQNDSKKPRSGENHAGRNRLPSHLTRQIVEHDIPAHQKVCTHCGALLSFIGCEEREQLEALIEKYVVLVHKRKKYACKNKACCCGTIVTAPTPAEPIEKGLAGPQLLAEIIVDKYSDHLPLYRLQQRFKRQGISMSRSTLWHWIYRSALLLEPLVNVMITHQIASTHVFADETTIPTLWAHIPENKGKQAKINYFWVYTSLKDDNKEKPIVVYRFATGRGSQYPTEFLKHFRGYMQVDGYSGYNPLFKAIPADELEEAYVQWCIEVACWGHARRYFMDVFKKNPKSIAKEVLLLIGDLYIYEAEFKKDKLMFDQIKAKRHELSKPKRDEIHAWLLKYQPCAAPKSALGQAIAYALNRWDALCVYLTDGRLEIDNTRSERNMKGIAVGRKNYLFVASNRGGGAAATVYSLIETCRQNGIDSKAYLADVLQRISTHPQSRINELLPYYWEPPGKTNDVALKNNQKAA
jgi:transposase